MYLIPNIIRRIIFFTLVFFYFSATGICQISGYQSGRLFYQLNTSHGLSDNYINDMCMDKSGNLWIASGEGLNMFNGKTVVKFFNKEYPQLQNDYIVQVVCDEKNRIWVMTDNGNLAIIDESRRFHRLHLYEKSIFIPARRILQTVSTGIILFTKNNHYTLNADTRFSTIDSLTLKNFSPILIKGFDSLYSKNFKQVESFDEQCYLFVQDSVFFKVNYKNRLAEKRYDLPGITALTKWDKNRLLVYNKTSALLEVINLSSGNIAYPFDKLTDQHGKKLLAKVTNAKWINDDQLMLTTIKEGFYIYTKNSNQLYNYRHNAADPTTIVNNSPLVIVTDSSGWVFTGATPNGVSYFKSNAVIGQQSVFLDRLGNSYDGHINNFATLDNDTYYIAVSDDVLEWKRSTNTTMFLSNANKSLSHLKKSGVGHVAFDNRQQLWMSVPREGIYVIDNNKKILKHLVYDITKLNSLPSMSVLHMQMGPDGYMWLSTRKGICRVNINTFDVDILDALPLKQLQQEVCYRTWFADTNTIWVATETKGAWKYNFTTRVLKTYTTADGLLGNEVFCFNKDRFDNMYIGTGKGLTIFFKNGYKKTITTTDGLLNKRIEALLRDKKGRMWIGNDVALACFNIADTSLKIFDERYGLSVQGFRINSYYQNPDDELIWGTERGLQYFYPDNLLQQKITLPTTINRLETRDITANLTQNAVFELSPADNNVSFYFTSIDYSTHLRTFYEYKLVGIDTNWISVVDQNFVRYNLLPPGKFVFKVRVSNDNKNWQNAENEVTVIIDTPVYKRAWFKLAGVLLGLLLLWVVVNYFRKKQKADREQLETEVVINYFASRINSHQKTGALLWDVAKNCISKLRFEDCVIYLIDETTNMLVQKAAYGPKNPVDFTIHKPIEIPVGKGITGTVALTGIAEIINDTTLDSRYILDDERRYSEIAVPILSNNKVVGVIDSEHRQKCFFTEKHLTILKTIAALCANQIQKTKAEEDRQKAAIEGWKNKQKATESRLQSLRLQMNPHFLFNALNSIQQMILANEEMVATKYLSRFSKLLRTVLIHSDKESITLKEEIEILKMYIELESVRFKESFSYSITCDEEIESEEIKIPTLLIQPFVENAIWHGLMHKEDNRQLSISFTEKKEFLQCIVQDNGVGRTKALEIKSTTGQEKQHTGKGIAVSEERLKVLKDSLGKHGTIQINDLTNATGESIGTQVIINFPIQN